MVGMDGMFSAAIAALVLTQAAAAGSVSLEHQTSARGGQVVVAVFSSEDNWKKNQHPVRTLRLQPGQSIQIEGLAPGRYGIMAFHDKNSDGKLNTLPIGLPTEPYGFSNNARGRFGPPNWQAASFEVRATMVSQSIRLR